MNYGIKMILHSKRLGIFVVKPVLVIPMCSLQRKAGLRIVFP